MMEQQAVERAYRILITGADGFLGRSVVQALGQRIDTEVVALDVRAVPAERQVDGVHYAVMDVRNPRLAQVLRSDRRDAVVHMDSSVTTDTDSNGAMACDAA